MGWRDRAAAVLRVAQRAPFVTRVGNRTAGAHAKSGSTSDGGFGRFVSRERLLPIVRALTPTAVVAASLVACSTSSAPPPPPTARVERTSVTQAVSSAGALSAVTEQNLGFNKAGQLKSVAVKVGQRVTAGEVLATLDDVPFRRQLEQQQGQLDSQRAALALQVNATTVRGAQRTTDQAGNIVDATQDQTDARLDADEVAIDRAQAQLDAAEDAQDTADDQVDAAEKACDASGGSSGGSSSSSSSLLGSLSGSGDDDDLSDKQRKQLEEQQKRLEAALKQAGSVAGSLVSSLGPCGQVGSAQSAAASADQQVEAAKTTLANAKQQRDVDAASGRLSEENAQQSLISAQNNLDAAQTDRPSQIAQQRGLVDAQAAVVREAQFDLDNTVLRAPVDGTVTAVNGAVGEYLQAGSVTTPLAPGSGGAIPGAANATSGTAGTPAAAARPGGTQFIVLDNVDRFEVVVPFEESDAIRLAPNQRVNVSFDAIPDLRLPGTVVAVSPSASALSGVISYYATVALSQGDPRLKNGQTAQASVLTTELDDVLAVPNAAVRRQGDRSTVTVLGFDGSARTVDFQPGVVGDDRTQVLSGLTAGDEVVVPAGR